MLAFQRAISETINRVSVSRMLGNPEIVLILYAAGNCMYVTGGCFVGKGEEDCKC